MAQPTAGATRERLISSAMRLFAENGFGGTTVGEIEGDAGLTPRGGAFYRHFQSKEEILTAGVDIHIAQAQQDIAALSLLPFGDLRSELLLVCRWLLESIDQHRHLFQVVEREADRLPQMARQCREQLLEPVLAGATDFTSRWANETGHPSADPQASAVIMIGAALNFRHMQWTYGSGILGVDDERFVNTWVHYCYDLMTGTSS